MATTPGIRGRFAHSGRSARQSCSWDSEHEAIFDTSRGPMTKRQYLAIKQRSGSSSRFDMFLGDIVDGFYTRRGCSCGGKIGYEGDKAVCKLCGTIFNDGGNTDGMVVSAKIFFDGHHEAAPPPKPRKNKTAIHAIMRAVS